MGEHQWHDTPQKLLAPFSSPQGLCWIFAAAASKLKSADHRASALLSLLLVPSAQIPYQLLCFFLQMHLVVAPTSSLARCYWCSVGASQTCSKL